MSGNTYFDHYKEIPRTLSFAPPTLLKKSFELIKQFKPQTVLETGCGQGELLRELEKNNKIQCSGYDLSAKAIELAKTHLLPKTQVFVHHALDPLSENYDLIIDGHLYHCLVYPHERRQYLNHIFLSLPPKGVFYLEMMDRPLELNADFLINETGALFKKVASEMKGSFLHHNSHFLPFRSFFSPLEESLYEQIGFKIEELRITSDIFDFEQLKPNLVSILLVKK